MLVVLLGAGSLIFIPLFPSPGPSSPDDELVPCWAASNICLGSQAPSTHSLILLLPLQREKESLGSGVGQLMS